MTKLNANQRLRIVPYKTGSASAKALAQAIGAKRIKLEGSKFRNRETDYVINWGNNNPPNHLNLEYVLNRPEALQTATNKLSFFEECQDADLQEIIPEFWTEKENIPDEAFPIVCRTKLTGHSGDGIVIADNRDALVPAPLYVKYIKKQDEYRIHVGIRDKESIIISVQQKRRRLEHPDDEVNWQVRNHANGFIYARENVDPPACVTEAALRAFEQATQLDFGAVDVIYNAKQNRAYVLEVNTAPGLEGQTLEDYANFFPNK